MKWYDGQLNYGGLPPNAQAFIYHPNFGLAFSPMGGTHLQAYKTVPDKLRYGLTEKPVHGRVFPNGSIGYDKTPFGVIYMYSGMNHIDEAKQAVENWMGQQQVKTASLPYKFVWADGQMAVAPGWRKDIHHMHLMQELGLTEMPQNMYAGTYAEDTFTGAPRISPDWEAYGNYPSDDELVEQIRQRLQESEHPGRTARKPW